MAIYVIQTTRGGGVPADCARQGDNPDATLTDTQEYAKQAAQGVKDGNDTSIGVSKDIRSELGTGSDTPAETGTLFAVLKWVKNKVVDIYNAVTAIVIPTDYSKQGTDPDATNTAILAQATSAATDAALAKSAAQAIVIPTDYSKQGTDPDATNTAILAQATAAATDAAAAKVASQSLTSLDSDINAGKQAIATAIAYKGVTSVTPQDTLLEMANGVMQIAQQPIEIDGGDMYAAQLTGDGVLWDLYTVLADMKNRFINASYEHGGQVYNFRALIVCEYYKGYDSLQLQGADSYYTCDGDFYGYASPNHVWHDDDSGKMNRWVAFLYHDEGARFDITDTSSSPRSMYIGGHIGTIEYFVNGRLTDLVCGVENSDVLDDFKQKDFTQQYNKTLYIKVKNVSGLTIPSSVNTAIVDVDNGYLAYDSGMVKFLSNYLYLSIKNPVGVSGTRKHLIHYNNDSNVTAGMIGVEIRGVTSASGYQSSIMFVREEGITPTLTNLSFFYVPDLENCSINLLKYPAPNLIDVMVGSLIVSLSFPAWNPTNVLADATKKAKLIENIKNHILARVSDATGGSQFVFTVSTNMYNDIASETITWQDQTMTLADAFLTKNWLLAGA